MFFPAIDEHRKLHATRASEVDQLIERGADRATSVKHVVDQHDVAVLDGAGKIGTIKNWFRADCRKVIAIKRDVEYADRWTITFEVSNLLRHAFGERHSAASDSHEEQVARPVIFFDDFGRQTRQRAIDARAIHNTSLLDKIHVRAILTRRAISRNPQLGVSCNPNEWFIARWCVQSSSVSHRRLLTNW